MANYERDMFTDLRISYSGHLNINKHNSQLYCYTYTFFTCYESKYIVIFLPNYIVVLLTKSMHVTVNNIIIQQNAI